jgi:hypothetical protein
MLTYMGGCNEYSSGGHATQVAGLIAGRREESDIFGLAPASWLVVAGSCSGSTAELQAVSSSAISQGAHIVNLSQEIDVGGWTDAHSRFYDSLANTSPFPTVIASAGNGGANYVRSPATGFNVIAVGNYNSGGQAWRGTNRTVNPTSSYNVRSTYNDRIKPDLSAPGTSLSTANPPDGATTVSGTSFAAAVVSGAAAQIMEQNPVLKYWPEATRAVLTASALDDLTAGNADGRGALYVRGAAAAARNNQFHVGSYTCGATPAERWVPLTAGVRTRIALTWSSDPNYAFPNEPSADLDIVVQNPGGFALSSWTWDNTTEKVDFVPTYSGLHRVVATVYRCSTARPTYWSMAWYQDFEAETSVLLPHYVYPTAGSGLSPAWQSVVTAANHYPHLKVLIVANAHSGQNDNSDSINYNTAIGIVQQSPRISALGYVATNDGNKDLTTVFNQIDRWLGNTDFSIGSQMFHYTNKVRGIFLDEADFGGYLGGDQAAFNTHYQTIRNYIVNTYPGKIVVANPGVSFAASFVQTGIDTFVGFEKGYWPSATDIQTISDRVGNVPSRLSVMVHSLAAPPSLSQINGVRGKVKYLITSPDPYVPDGAWNSPIPDDYFDLLFKRL